MSSTTLKRAQLPSFSTSQHTPTQVRHASLLRRPHRPYQFTQLVVLSDGSTYTHRTTSPLPVYRSTKDTKNHQLWQPTSSALKNVEADQAGRLRAFRKRFGRGWDLDAKNEEEEGEVHVKGKESQGSKKSIEKESSADESLMDLISGFAESQAGDSKKK